MVVTNDCHYVNKSDAKAHEILLAIQTGKTTKPFGCGPDCLSHFSVVALQFQSAVTGPETTSPPVLTDALPSAEDQPPIKG